MEEYFLSIEEIPKKLTTPYQNFRGTVIRYSFKSSIYEWCRENKIHYKRTKKKPFGFFFKNKEEAMAVKLRWW